MRELFVKGDVTALFRPRPVRSRPDAKPTAGGKDEKRMTAYEDARCPAPAAVRMPAISVGPR